MHKPLFGLLTCVTIGCAGYTSAIADDDLDQRYASIVAEACIEHGKMGSTPEVLTRNCTCVGDVMTQYVPTELKTRSVLRGKFDDSEWAEIRGTPAENKISEGLYQDCAMSYAVIEAWP